MKWKMELGELFNKVIVPSFEEGRPRRPNNVTLPEEVGVAGEVRHPVLRGV